MNASSPGRKFRLALRDEKLLQIIGTVNAHAAMMAVRVGYRAIYLSGAGVAMVLLQTRAELYEFLGYKAHEEQIDQLYKP